MKVGSVKYKGHKIVEFDSSLGKMFGFHGPTVKGGTWTLVQAKQMIDYAIKQQKCRDSKTGHTPGSKLVPGTKTLTACTKCNALTFLKTKVTK